MLAALGRSWQTTEEADGVRGRQVGAPARLDYRDMFRPKARTAHGARVRGKETKQTNRRPRVDRDATGDRSEKEKDGAGNW